MSDDANAGPLRLIVAAPIYNEAEGIRTFLQRVDQAVGTLAASHPDVETELLLVDDGSTDQSVEFVRAFEPKHLARVQLVRLSRNVGHSPAVSAIFDLADGDALIVMDADLQDDPALIPDLVSDWRSGVDCVRVRRGRRNEGAAFSLLSRGFYRMFESVSGLESSMGTYGLYGRRVVNAVRSFPEVVRYHPGLVSLAGYAVRTRTADRDARLSGSSRVGFLRLVRLALMAMVSFSSAPIYLVSALGLVFSVLSTLAGIGVISIRLFTDLAIPGWASFLTVQFFIGGIVILSLGVVGQYVAILFEEVKARPRYFVDADEVVYERR